MKNDNHYIDPDYVYTDPKTGVLRNLANVNDFNTLLFIESGAVTKRIAELQAKPIKIKNSSTLLDIHKYLFRLGRQNNQQGGKTFFSVEPLSQRFYVYL